MEITVLNQTLTLDTAPMHIAPGGSVLCSVVGNARRIAKLLIELREEIAFGMANLTTIDASSETVSADIYFGKADETDFQTLFSNFGEGLCFDRRTLPEDHVQTGLAMSSRNRVIELLK